MGFGIFFPKPENLPSDVRPSTGVSGEQRRVAGLGYVLLTRAAIRGDDLSLMERSGIPGEALSMIPITS